MFRLAAEKSMKFGIFLVIQDSFFVTFVNGELFSCHFYFSIAKIQMQNWILFSFKEFFLVLLVDALFTWNLLN
jgi:hypothetical protein